MPYKPKPWPYQAIGALEDVTSYLKDIERLAHEVQAAAVNGDKLQCVMIAGTIRTKAMLAHSTLVAAKAGEYKRDATN